MTDRTIGDTVPPRDGSTSGLVVGGAGGVVAPGDQERTARFVGRVGFEAIRAQAPRFTPCPPQGDPR